MNPATAHSITALARWAEPWHHEFTRSAVVSTAVLFAHLVSLVGAGGLSFTADRASLASSHAQSDAWTHDLRLRITNRRLAIVALTGTVLSGALLFLSDVDAFVQLGTFWVKMSLVVLLLINAGFAERHDRRLASGAGAESLRTGRVPSRCRAYACVSLTLWFFTLLAGTALNVG